MSIANCGKKFRLIGALLVYCLRPYSGLLAVLQIAQYWKFKPIRPIQAVNAFFMQYIIGPMVYECPVKIWWLYDSSIKNKQNFIFQANQADSGSRHEIQCIFNAKW